MIHAASFSNHVRISAKLVPIPRIIPAVLKLFSILPLFLALTVSAFAQTTVSFQRDIAPILQRRCASCHNEENPKGGYRLDTYAAFLTAGDSGATPITPGKITASEIHRLLIATDKDERMPQKADALPEDEIRIVERWIAEGAAFDGGDPQRSLAELVRDLHLRPAPTHYARPVPITALAFNGDGRRLAVNGYREVLLWNPTTGTLERRIGAMPERISSLAWHPAKNLLAVAGGTPGQWGTVAVIDPANRYAVRYLSDLAELVLSVAFTRDGGTLVAGCGDRTLRFFDTSSGKQTKVLRLHADWVQAIAFNPGGTRLVTASRDRTARVLDTTDWQQLASYPGHDSALLAATFTHDGSRIVTTARGAAHVWHPEQANRRATLSDLGGDVKQLAAGPFGIAAASDDGIVRLYQGEIREPWMLLEGHRDSVQSLATSRSGELLASGSADGEVIVWTPSCWAPVARFMAAP